MFSLAGEAVDFFYFIFFKKVPDSTWQPLSNAVPDHFLHGFPI